MPILFPFMTLKESVVDKKYTTDSFNFMIDKNGG
jgi:hypothetical protein